jgi:hypothetical protein
MLATEQSTHAARHTGGRLLASMPRVRVDALRARLGHARDLVFARVGGSGANFWEMGRSQGVGNARRGFPRGQRSVGSACLPEQGQLGAVRRLRGRKSGGGDGGWGWVPRAKDSGSTHGLA